MPTKIATPCKVVRCSNSTDRYELWDVSDDWVLGSLSKSEANQIALGLNGSELFDACVEALRSLINELPDFALEGVREVWGHTNANCILAKRNIARNVLAEIDKMKGK